jgi:hypothetical protein
MAEHKQSQELMNFLITSTILNIMQRPAVGKNRIAVSKPAIKFLL